MTRTLAQWLEHIQALHPVAIDMGLARVREVAARGVPLRPARVVITVGGTNGKGSTVALLDAMLRAAGHRVGAYTSPHLFRYEERVRIDGVPIAGEALSASFARVEAARGDTGLTYFEFGTLAALDAFARASLDVAILEVGLGGRLDAVNLVDADLAVLTTIDLDHQEFLGRDRESIGFEKAGILRAGAPAVLGDLDPPRSVLDHAVRIGAPVLRFGHDFGYEDLPIAPGDGESAATWRWRDRAGRRLDLPEPALSAPVQAVNASVAIAALSALAARLPVSDSALAAGVSQARVPGRLQRVAGTPEVVVDVAHNPQAAREVARWLARERRAVRIVYGALGDKDVAGVAAALAPHATGWHLGGLERDTPRGLTATDLCARIGPHVAGRPVTMHATVLDALADARGVSRADERVLVIGSFFTAAAALSELCK